MNLEVEAVATMKRHQQQKGEIMDERLERAVEQAFEGIWVSKKLGAGRKAWMIRFLFWLVLDTEAKCVADRLAVISRFDPEAWLPGDPTGLQAYIDSEPWYHSNREATDDEGADAAKPIR